MQFKTEVKRLCVAVAVAVAFEREFLRGLTFADVPDAFKNLESLKVRLAVAKNPNHFAEKYAQWFAARAARRVH